MALEDFGEGSGVYCGHLYVHLLGQYIFFFLAKDA